MIDGLKPYPAMKDSGVPWLGAVPEHWEVRPLRHLATLEGRKGTTSADTCDADTGVLNATPSELNGRIRGMRTRRYVEAARHQSFDIAPAGSTAICTIASVGQSSRFVRPFATNPQVRALVPREGVAGEFLFLLTLLLKPELQRIASTSVVPFVNGSDVTSLRVLAPPLPEQAAIVRFLDHADRRIRRYIRAKQKLIKLLEEQKQAIIHRAVTRGLDPNVRLKPSGVEWLGDVPEHWEVKRLRNLAEMRVSNVDKHTKEDEQPVRLCNYVDVYKNDYISPSMNLMRATATKEEMERFRLAVGDVLITKDSEAWNDIGVPALVLVSADDMISGYHLALLRPLQTRIAGEFLFRALQSAGVQYQFHVEANGVTRYGLSHAAIKSVWIPAPPLAEQFAIINFLKGATASLVSAVERAYREIDLLREYRTRLIADVVTGKLDVREAAARLPDEVEEPESLDEIEAEGDSDEAGTDDADAVPEEVEA